MCEVMGENVRRVLFFGEGGREFTWERGGVLFGMAKQVVRV